MRLILFLFLFASMQVFSQEKSIPNRANLVFGIGQITQGGFNIEGNLFYNRLAVDYSHGVGLNIFNNQLEEGNDKTQGLDIHIPWTTGFGVGYRFTDWLNLRVEPKWHKFELYEMENEQRNENLLGAYTTFTVGLGLYCNWLPFKKKENLLKGIMLVPNVRWWPRVSSTLDNNELTYFNQRSQRQETHEARQIGIGNTPFFYNISLGYSVQF